jgi:hypothetical protein
MKTYGGVEVLLHAFLTSVLYGGEWSDSRSSTPLRRLKSSRYPLDRRLGRHRSRSGRGGEEKKKSLPWLESNPGRPTRSLVPILTELLRLLEVRIACSILVGNPEVTKPLIRSHKHMWEVTVKVYLEDLGCEGVECIHLAQGRVQWRHLLHMTMNLRFPWKAGNLWPAEWLSASEERLYSVKLVLKFCLGRNE